ncbi:niacin transporter [Clostridium cavendishii DSM 21758]|uniref:Niacin transporter n=1 Tax=Clostridium cavendishii DSM 21758 TaxID=1121302 RepID=A0A1M6ESW4_9CLOT|nr:ECF transporter S component [Clostridium cavendishii]SHI88440.1 niacin transporter [Clostridium cavendishii DSM 21758]
MRNKKIVEMTYSALLIAFAIIIPIQFGFLKITIPPFTATIAAHVPIFLAMFISPFVGAIVGLGSTIGFLLAGTPAFVVARASVHIFVALVGGIMYKKNIGFFKIVLVTGLIHAIGEAIAVIPFGFTGVKVLGILSLGFFIHHFVDAFIAISLVKAIEKATGKRFGKSITE